MTTLGEYIKVQGGYAYKSKDFIESSDNKVLKIKNVRFGTIDYSEPAYVSNEIAEATKNWKVKEGDVLISMTGSGPNAPQSLVGRVARVWKNEPDAWINQRVGRVCLLDEAPVHLDFIFYWLSLPQSQDYLVSNSSGSANQANISGKIIESLPCPKVDYQISKQIADLARKFDEKIILNSQTNQTLEEMAQAIFKSWFVDFDPVKAKMNGELPEGMDTATASLFPEKLVESELGLIPEGWEVLESQKVATVAIGKTPPRKEPQWFSENPSNVTWVSIKDMGNAGTYALDSSEYLTPEAVDKFNVKVIPDNTLILSFKLTVGRVAITHGEMTTNEAIAHYKLTDDARVSTNFLYSYMKQFNFESLGSTSSIAKAVNSKIIKALPVIVPSKEILDSFDTLVKPLFDKIKSNQMENQNLEALRDTLLPKLLSGEIELDKVLDV
ncbi:restriction endonuclease subunit S [Vibrio splendidus]|uniref:restriction endonuclease subunit S n=1 Tax=Vibrio splendidus TaxID=29497 RepID=UPI00352F1B03